MSGFREFLKKIKEETTSADIATVDTMLGTTQKKCKNHNKFNCKICKEIRPLLNRNML